jgi:SHS2 domain-containing protein
MQSEYGSQLSHERASNACDSAGGSTVQQAFEQVALAMFNYMTPLSGISIDESSTR